MPSHDESATTLARRGMIGLALAGGVLWAPAAMGAGAEKADKKSAEKGGEVSAVEDLMREHGVLRRILILYREAAGRLHAGQKIDVAALHSAAGLFQNFGERYHETMLEQEHVFPVLRGTRLAAMVDTLLLQHRRGNEITAWIIGRTKGGGIGSADAAPMGSALLAFARMYEAHSAREDTMVFPAFKNALSPARIAALGEQFEEIERRQFGGDGFDMALATIARAEAAFGLADLASFTAPAPPQR
jgi:hemerythrin-like domain-containing protein